MFPCVKADKLSDIRASLWNWNWHRFPARSSGFKNSSDVLSERPEVLYVWLVAASKEQLWGWTGVHKFDHLNVSHDLLLTSASSLGSQWQSQVLRGLRWTNGAHWANMGGCGHIRAAIVPLKIIGTYNYLFFLSV